MSTEHSEIIDGQVARCLALAERWGNDASASTDIIMQTFMEIRAEAPTLPLSERRKIVTEIGNRLLAAVTPAEPKKYKGLAGKHVLRSRRDNFLFSLGTLAVGAAKS